MQNESILVYIYEAIIKWRWPYLGSLLVTAILVSGVMLLKPNIYRASTIFYPASISIQKPVFTEAEQNINYYGDDHDVDRMLSIAKSINTKKEIISNLKLAQHYNYLDHRKSEEKTFDLFNKNYHVIKTEYDAISISFDDKDSEVAARAANIAAEKVSEKTQYIIKRAQRDAIINAELSLKIIEEQMDDLNNQLTEKRIKFGVYDTESQAEAFAILETRGIDKRDLNNRIASYTQGVSKVKALEEQLAYASEMIVKNKSNLYRLRSALESDISSLHMIQTADAPMKKHGPRRSLYVLGSVFLIGALGLLSILIIEQTKSIRQELADAA